MYMKKLGIVVPYRDRQQHLDKFVPHMTDYLRTVNHHIYIIEQEAGKPFNRGKLLNVGFKSLPVDVTHICLHDVDMLPIDANYFMGEDIHHIATAAEQFEYKMPYPDYFGGVTMFPVDIYAIVNGFDNEFWGWGAEDDDLHDRVKIEGYPVIRNVNRFHSLKHKHALQTEQSRALHRKNSQRLLANRARRIYDNGLTNCEYTILSTEQLQYNATKLTVRL